MNLKKHLPHLYKDVVETDVLIDVENELFRELEQITADIEKNQFVLTADDLGLRIFENMLNIKTNEEEDLQTRRERIIRLFTISPYTTAYLIQVLDTLLGEGQYTLRFGTISFGADIVLNITTHINIPNKMKELLLTLIDISPINLGWNISNNLESNVSQNVYIGVSCEVTNWIELFVSEN